jgi:hypothetical protein
MAAAVAVSQDSLCFAFRFAADFAVDLPVIAPKTAGMVMQFQCCCRPRCLRHEW